MSQSKYEGKQVQRAEDNRVVGSFFDQLVGGRSFSGHEPNCCFLNSGQTNTNTPQFINVSAISGFDRADDGRGIALVDWDHDGDIDLWTSNRNAPRLRFLRNDSGKDHHFLQIRLVGTSQNTPRDAIGARVTVYVRTPASEPAPIQMKTLRAGEGFLSQSSKWLHFGLGKSTEVERVVVRWPGGTEETFQDLSADQWYELKQGVGKARTLGDRSRQLQLTAAEQTLPEPYDEARIPLTTRLPLPELAYQAWSGENVMLRTNGKPLLINFWASWCQPCLAELHEFTAHQKEIEQAGIRVVALSVDGLGEDKSTVAAAQLAIEKMNFPFVHGRATEGILRNMHGLHDLIVRISDRKLSVPLSFLVDSQGRLSVIYRGKVSPKTLLEDATYEPVTRSELATRSAFFPGRIIQHPRVEQIATKKDLALRHAFAQILKQAGQIDEAIRHYREMVERSPTRPDIWSELGDLLFLKSKIQEANSAYRTAIECDAKYPPALVGVGNVFLLKDDLSNAADYFQRSIQSDDEHAPAYLQLGITRQRQNQPHAAADRLKRFLSLRPNSAFGNTRLASVMATLGHMREAKTHFENAVRLNKDDVEAINGLAWILATAKDPNLRDQERALKLAKTSALNSAYRNPGCLDTLAAAYAGMGDFEKAVHWQQRAIDLVPPTRRGSMQDRLELYRKNQPPVP